MTTTALLGLIEIIDADTSVDGRSISIFDFAEVLDQTPLQAVASARRKPQLGR